MGTRMPTQRPRTRARRTAPLSPPNRIHRRTLPAPRQQPSRAQTPAPRIRNRETQALQVATMAQPQTAQILVRVLATLRIRIPTAETTLDQPVRAAMPQTQGQRGRNRAHRRNRKRGRANNPRRNILLGTKSRGAATRAQVKTNSAPQPTPRKRMHTCKSGPASFANPPPFRANMLVVLPIALRAR